MRASAVKFLGRCNGWNGRMGEMKNHNARKKFLDLCQYLGDCPPAPPLTQQLSIDNNVRLMLG